ncbi:MAG: spore germination protein [Candidatus Coprovivens sp.]
MITDKLKEEFNNSTDLIHKQFNKINIIYLESLCNSDKINEYILQNITLGHKYLFLKDIVSGPNVIYVEDYNLIKEYLLNGFALVYDKKDMLVCEVKGDLYRSITPPTAETAVNGPKDSFNESIIMNLGLIKRRIKTSKLINEDFSLGTKTLTKVSMLYCDDIVKKDLLEEVRKRINKIKIDGIIDIEVLMQYMSDDVDSSPMPTLLKTERPDRVSQALLEGKVVLIADNSPYALILPAFFSDFVNPQGDKYVRAINVNAIKVIRFLCVVITIILPSLYIAIINYSPETIPIQLLLSFQAGRSGVPFPSSFESLFMIFLCTILRESDIRFPSTYGSSISILGALILGEAAVAANIASPIMIIIIGITFVTGLVFSSGEVIDGLRTYRLLLLILTIIFGLYGFVIGSFFIVVNLCNTESFGKPYLYPIAPFNKNYFFKTLLKKDKDMKRNKMLTDNITRGNI